MITMKLQERREALGYTQAELGGKIGVAQSVISEWENGNYLPKAKQLPALAKALNCTIDELLSGQGGVVIMMQTNREQTTIRLPAGLKEQLQREADRRGDSFNETVIRLILAGMEYQSHRFRSRTL